MEAITEAIFTEVGCMEVASHTERTSTEVSTEGTEDTRSIEEYPAFKVSVWQTYVFVALNRGPLRFKYDVRLD